MLDSKKTLIQKSKEWILSVLIALTVALPVRAFVAEPFVVKGKSMLPNLKPGEYLFVEKITYRFFEPQPGDVVVLVSPLNNKDKYIKRVIAGPGDKVKIADNSLYIWKNKRWEKVTSYSPLPLKDKIYILGKGEYFVIGDNTAHSLDSRVFGPVRKDKIIGKAFLSLWPPDKLGIVE